jgi:short-subunit dehydrogenase
MIPYSASKFALVGYSEGLRAELLKDGILVTTVCPGLIRTGSPHHAIVKGQHEKEYAWFKIADALPLVTVSAETCAEQVLDACRIGRAEVVVSLPAKMLTALHNSIPGLFIDTLSVVNRLLPSPGGIGEQSTKGYESESAVSRSFVATLADQAAKANNE